MQMLKLTKLNGKRIYVRFEHVAAVTPAMTKDGKVCTILVIDGIKYWVLETLKDLGLPG